MERIDQLKNAKTILDEMGGDPQVAFAAIQIAEYVNNDPQKITALLKIAQFITQAHKSNKLCPEMEKCIDEVGIDNLPWCCRNCNFNSKPANDEEIMVSAELRFNIVESGRNFTKLFK